MSVRTRLVFLLVALSTLLVVGRLSTGGFGFLLSDFWFTAGLFLLLLLSLIDQPHFSKDASIFVNGTTGWVSLLLVPAAGRDGFWWMFLGWSSYLILSSYALMWARSKSLRQESALVQAVARINRQIGRPEALFSAFFLWGCVHQFGSTARTLEPLFLFWAAFMILNIPAVAGVIDGLLTREKREVRSVGGVLLSINSPRIAEALLSTDIPGNLTGRTVHIRSALGAPVASAVLVDDRVVAGRRIGRLAITALAEGWPAVGKPGGVACTLEIDEEAAEQVDAPISVVDTGTEIGRLVFHVHPDQELQSGEVLRVQISADTSAYYQAVTATVAQTSTGEGNSIQSVRVGAGLLGVWDAAPCRFAPVGWVAPAGGPVWQVPLTTAVPYTIPAGRVTVGNIPDSQFPIHVGIEDLVTHNTAVIGVTGSGKSYLAFHLIEAMVGHGVKVLILDITREHDLNLSHLKPTAIRKASEVAAWWSSDSPIGIHQYAVDAKGYPAVTAEFAAAAFAEASKAKLERGKNLPARLCVVFEEAHSLIPEWNQVAQEGDKHQVNCTARTILQGRKFGMGALVITQRTANVTKTILNQCNTIFAMQSFDQTGLDFLRNYMGEEYSHAISTLPIRHAVLVGKASSSMRPVILRVADLKPKPIEAVAETDAAAEHPAAGADMA